MHRFTISVQQMCYTWRVHLHKRSTGPTPFKLASAAMNGETQWMLYCEANTDDEYAHAHAHTHTHTHNSSTGRPFEQEGHYNNITGRHSAHFQQSSHQLLLTLPRTAMLLGRSNSENGSDKGKHLHHILLPHKRTPQQSDQRPMVTSFCGRAWSRS